MGHGDLAGSVGRAPTGDHRAQPERGAPAVNQLGEHYQHLGSYSDWALGCLKKARTEPLPLGEIRQRAKLLLDVPARAEEPADVRLEHRWERDGVAGEELSWWVGYGPRTRAWLLRPSGAPARLPGVLALHDHGGFKFYGKEKIADGPSPPGAEVRALRLESYAGRAFASDLAREGFCVLVNDVFGWGSRRFPYEEMPPLVRRLAEATRDLVPGPPTHDMREDIATYNAAAWHHEHLVAKYAAVLGTSLSAVVSAEDRAALAYLLSRPEVNGRAGCIGLSGGGCRAALLTSTSDDVATAVIVGMMSTYEGLLDHSVVDHTWMFFPPGLVRFADWPDLAACHAPAPLLVQYNLSDELFPVAGSQAAHRRISDHYMAMGAPKGYVGRFYPGGHKFDALMQQDAFAWLHQQLGA